MLSHLIAGRWAFCQRHSTCPTSSLSISLRNAPLWRVGRIGFRTDSRRTRAIRVCRPHMPRRIWTRCCLQRLLTRLLRLALYSMRSIQAIYWVSRRDDGALWHVARLRLGRRICASWSCCRCQRGCRWRCAGRTCHRSNGDGARWLISRDSHWIRTSRVEWRGRVWSGSV